MFFNYEDIRKSKPMYDFFENGANHPGSAKPTPCRVSAAPENLAGPRGRRKPRERLAEADERPLNDGCVRRDKLALALLDRRMTSNQSSITRIEKHAARRQFRKLRPSCSIARNFLHERPHISTTRVSTQSCDHRDKSTLRHASGPCPPMGRSIE